MRRLLLVAAALAIVLTPLISILPSGVPGAAVGVAAASGLTTTADARYTVDPAGRRVRVAVTLSATNHLSDTRTRRFFYDRVYLAVPPGTTGFKVASAGAHPSVSVAARKSGYTLLRIAFGANLAAGATRSFRLGFDMPDPGGSATRTTRIGLSLVRFSVWGIAGDGATGGSVSVVFPSGFNVEATGGALRKSTDGSGNLVFSSGRLANPTTFLATFDADRPAALKESRLQIPLGSETVPITLRAWPDDAAWAKRVGDTLRKGLPILAKDIGLPWAPSRPLVVQESANRGAAGFAGRYDPAAGTIDLAYYADPLLILRQAAHAWFDGSLLADRWANEGFASFYAIRAARAIGVKVPAGDPLTKVLRPAVVPLNAWALPADDAASAMSAAEATSQNAEQAAALTLAGLVAKRAGLDGLRSVWQAIRDGRGAYQPIGTGVDVERTEGTPDWRGLLDLLGDRTGGDFTDLWSTWVVRPNEASLLTDRAAARDRYDQMVTRAGSWRLPPVVREALRVWRYDDLGQLLDAASTALDAREHVAAAAAAAGLTVSSSMQTAFEGPRGFAAASAEATAELSAIDAYRAALAARPSQTSPIQAIGLWSASPQASLDAAAAAYASGDLAATVRNSVFARQTWEAADSVGRNRIIAVSASLAAILLAASLALRWYLDRGVRRRAVLTDG